MIIKRYPNDGVYKLSSCQGENYIWLQGLYVSPEHRRKGEGRRILREAIAEAKKFGLEIYLEAAPGMDADISLSDLVYFYESEGFVIDNATEEGILMKLAP